MNKPSRDGGGAMIAVAMVFMILIVMLVGGGLFFFVLLQRSAQHEAVVRALHAEELAMAMAEKQRIMVEQQASAAKQQVAESLAIAKRDSTVSGVEDPTPAGGQPITASDQPKTAIDKLGWLVNHWRQSDGTTSSEELWIAPRGGMMLGVNRNASDEGKSSFEYLRIESTENDQMIYYASPMGRGETEFPLLEVTEDRVVFENPAHDFPRRISYWLDVDLRLHARVEGEIDGKPHEMEWTWTAVR